MLLVDSFISPEENDSIGETVPIDFPRFPRRGFRRFEGNGITPTPLVLTLDTKLLIDVSKQRDSVSDGCWCPEDNENVELLTSIIDADENDALLIVSIDMLMSSGLSSSDTYLIPLLPLLLLLLTGNDGLLLVLRGRNGSFPSMFAVSSLPPSPPP
jgi:hypothetical protein